MSARTEHWTSVAGLAAGAFMALAAIFGWTQPAAAAHNVTSPSGDTTSPVTITDTITGGETNPAFPVMCLGLCTSVDCQAGDFSGADSIDYFCIDESFPGSGDGNGTWTCDVEIPVGTPIKNGGAWRAATESCVGSWGFGNFNQFNGGNGWVVLETPPWYTNSIMSAPSSAWGQIIGANSRYLVILVSVVGGVLLIIRLFRRMSR